MSTPQSGAAPRRAANPRRRGGQRNRSSANPADDTEQVKLLRSKYTHQLSVIQELFPDWSDEDLLFALQESNGDVELAVGRISEGHASQFSSVKTKKQTRKEAAAAHAAAPASAATSAAPAASVSAASTPAASTDAAGPRARTRNAERGAARGRGAPAQAARAGRGGFRGVGARGGATGAVAVSAQADAKPITTTQAAFRVSQQPAQPASERSTAASAAEKPKTGMSWAQIARPAEKPAPAPAAPAQTAVPTATAAKAPTATPAAPEPAIDTEITQPALALDAAQNASEGARAAPSEPSVAPASAPAPAAAPVSSRGARARAHQDAPVVMPGGAASLDRLGVQFGSLNFMVGDEAQQPFAGADETSSARAGFADVDAKRDAPADAASFPQQGLDAFKSHGFNASHNAYGLASDNANTRPTFEQTDESLHANGPSGAAAAAGGAPAPTVPAAGFTGAPSSIYNTPLDSQRNALYYGAHHTATPMSLRGDERASPAAHAVPTPGEAPSVPPAQPPQPATPAGAPGLQQQQPFPNLMPYYYPYYMPSQFQHYASPAGGFGQYQMYGGQPQHPTKPDATPTGPSLASPYLHHGGPADAAAVYGTHTPPPHFQPHTAVGASYDAQGFGQRMPSLNQPTASDGFKLQGNADADAGSLPGLSNFLSAGQAQQGGIPPQSRAGAPNAGAQSSPLDYRSFDAAKSPAAGANRAATGAPTGQPVQQQPAQQHPAYYQQYAGNFGHQGTAAYNGYSYGRQQQPPYWG
ncbi:RNAPII degradation factor [Malassezia brasiliensis]|uniref:RNA polymerase II degradation factor 1 n=1 Tax=Malassezia brasiliensis TaxID=1821822 RepID=A0AAF0DT40_9BASI|nr:RNAPII degradation factor [Malassezia brasiliensis]